MEREPRDQTIAATSIRSGEAWGSPTVSVSPPRHFELLETAAELGRAGHLASAVVAAQAAVEVYVEQVMTNLVVELGFGPFGDAALNLTRSFNLNAPRERGLFNALVVASGERVEGDSDLWQKYRLHLERRNRFVHAGEEPDMDGTQESLVVALGLVNRIYSLFIGTTGSRTTGALSARGRQQPRARTPAPSPSAKG